MSPNRIPLMGLVRVLLAILAVGALCARPAWADTRSVLVMFKPGVVELPAGDLKSVATRAQTSITSTAVENVLATSNVETIGRTFPDFALADTLGISLTGEPVYLINLSEVYTLTVPEGGDPQALASALAAQTDDVVYAEPDGLVMPLDPVYPDDPYFTSQWGLHNTGQLGGVPDVDIDAPEAWETTTGSSAVIGIVDGGADNSHPDLAGKVSGDAGWGWDGHGFHVAGIAAANTYNGLGVAGVNWQALINAQRIDNAGDDGDVYDAIMAAVNAGATVLNNSWTLTDGSGNPRSSMTVRAAFANAYKMNRVACAAMGNAGSSAVWYPAGFGQGITAVGAMDRSDDVASFSSYGPHIDVAAPGVSIWSCVPYSPWYQAWNGTSMATPFVSGTASLLRAYNPSLANDDVEQIIRLSADDMTNPPATVGFDDYTGMGRLNARSALDLLSLPHSFYQQTASGGSSGGYTNVTMVFIGVPGLAAGTYPCRRYEVTRAVTFPAGLAGPPNVWGRGAFTTGYSAANPNYGMGYCDVVGTVTSTGCTMRTWVYDVYNVLGQHVGWYPSQVGGVNFAYSVLGQHTPVAASISGPSSLATGDVGTWTANPTGGNGSYTYEWRVRADGVGAWSPVIGTSQSLTRGMSSGDMQLQAHVSSAGTEAYAVYCVGNTANPAAPVVSISGPTSLTSGAQGTWTATPTGGRSCSSYGYEWRWRQSPNGTWSEVVSASPSYTRTMPAYSIDLQAAVTGQQTGYAQYTVTLSGGGGGGGCPFVDVLAADGWKVGNSILGRSLAGELQQDHYRLPVAPVLTDDGYHLRLREDEEEHTRLDQVGLIAVDHDPSVEAFVEDGRITLGRPVAPARVTTEDGRDVTEQVNGHGGGGFLGRPGDVLIVEFTAPATEDETAAGITPVRQLGPIMLASMKKEMAEAMSPVDRRALIAKAPLEYDRLVLERTGIRIEVPDGEGGWREVIRQYPRENLDVAVTGTQESDVYRLVFVGEHRLSFAGRMVRIDPGNAATSLRMLEATHSQLGNVATAVGSLGGDEATLVKGEAIQLRFEAPAIPDGKVRDFFLVSTGVYSSSAEGAKPVVTEFALAQNRPNPFRGTTEFRFALPKASRVRLEVFDLQGRRIAMLADREFAAGWQTVAWDGTTPAGARVNAGIYLYRLTADAGRLTKKMLVLP